MCSSPAATFLVLGTQKVPVARAVGQCTVVGVVVVNVFGDEVPGGKNRTGVLGFAPELVVGRYKVLALRVGNHRHELAATIHLPHNVAAVESGSEVGTSVYHK